MESCSGTASRSPRGRMCEAGNLGWQRASTCGPPTGDCGEVPPGTRPRLRAVPETTEPLRSRTAGVRVVSEGRHATYAHGCRSPDERSPSLPDLPARQRFITVEAVRNRSPCCVGSVGGIVSTLLRTTGSRNIRGRTGGGPVVLWLTLTVVGSLVATALAIALARSSTARWEQEKRAARAARRASVAVSMTATRRGVLVGKPGRCLAQPVKP